MPIDADAAAFSPAAAFAETFPKAADEVAIACASATGSPGNTDSQETAAPADVCLHALPPVRSRVSADAELIVAACALKIETAQA
jgi:hypothetical protein